MSPHAPPRGFFARYVLPWFLMCGAAGGALLVLGATALHWDTFGPMGRFVGVGAVLFAFATLAALVLAFVSSVLMPALRHRHEDSL